MSRALRTLVVSLTLTLACSRHEPAPSSSPSEAPVDASPAGSSAAPVGLSDGSGDYRGTLGPTAIAMHLVVGGDAGAGAVSGAYVYRAVGHLIALAGAVETGGTLHLTESVGGKSTGTFALHPRSGAALALDGEWSAPGGAKTLDVHLMPGDPWGGVSSRAEACLRDPACSAAEASRLFIEADDDHEADADCFRFLDGAGTPRDVARARACLQRGPSRASCNDGSSASIDLAELALMHIDGVGGPVDLAGGRALLEPCFDDVTKSGVLDHATVRERDPKTPPMNFCKDYGGTTLTSNDCVARARTVEETQSDLQAKLAAAGLDDAGKTLFVAATKAYAAYVDAMGGEAYAAYAGGTVRNAVALARENDLLAVRTKDLAAFPRFVAVAASPAGVAKAQAGARACAASEVKGDAAPGDDERTARAKAEAAWASYRDAEIALYVHAFGAAQGADRVRAALLVTLESRRAKECAVPSLASP